ncbi:MAG: hypothetical protein PHQ05_04485 [Sterolibacterium sp.]|nr:hypothetical protein [Sterolibacterium sp.]
MKAIKLTIALLLLGAAGLSGAWADRGHAHFSVVFGPVPYWGPWYYQPPPYYYPPIVIERPVPQVYIEQPSAVAAPTASASATLTNYWYYCTTAKGYYPYVKECPGGWQKTLPQPPVQP